MYRYPKISLSFDENISHKASKGSRFEEFNKPRKIQKNLKIRTSKKDNHINRSTNIYRENQRLGYRFEFIELETIAANYKFFYACRVWASVCCVGRSKPFTMTDKIF